MNTQETREEFVNLCAEVAREQAALRVKGVKVVQLCHELQLSAVIEAFPNCEIVEANAISIIRPEDNEQAAAATCAQLKASGNIPTRIWVDSNRKVITLIK